MGRIKDNGNKQCPWWSHITGNAKIDADGDCAFSLLIVRMKKSESEKSALKNITDQNDWLFAHEQFWGERSPEEKT